MLSVQSVAFWSRLTFSRFFRRATITCSLTLSSFFVEKTLSLNERAHCLSMAVKTRFFMPNLTLALNCTTLSVYCLHSLTICLNLTLRARPRFCERRSWFGLNLFLRVQKLWKSRRSNLQSWSFGMTWNPINFIRMSIAIGFFFIRWLIFKIDSLVRLARYRHCLKHFLRILLLKCWLATTDMAPSSFSSFDTLRIFISIVYIKFLSVRALKWAVFSTLRILSLFATLNALKVLRNKISSCLLIALISPLSNLFFKIFWRWCSFTYYCHALKQSSKVLNCVLDL